MKKISKSTATALLAAAVLLPLTGCSSLNSQVLDLHPQVQVSRQLPEDIKIEIKSYDLRKSPVIGYRPGNNAEPAEIRLKDSIELLTHSTEHALEDMGIRRFYAGEFLMNVSLLDLNYQVNKQKLKQTVDIEMKLRVKAEKSGKAYTGEYFTERQHIYLSTPSEDENEKIINELVSTTLTNAMNDPQLLDFLQFN